MGDFIHIKAVTDGKEYYINVDAKNGATIILPGVGTVALSTDDIQKIVDFRAGFDYNDVLVRRRKINGINPDTLEYNVLNEETNQLVLVAFVLKTNLDQPDIEFDTINVADGKSSTQIKLPFTVVDVLLREFASKGFVSALPAIADIKYVEKLPNETGAESGVVYLLGTDYYKLNQNEDGFDKIEGTFVNVTTLPEFKPVAKEGVLYNLTGDWTYTPTKDKYSKGVYTFDATKNEFTLTELKIVTAKALPEVKDAAANTIYTLIKSDGERAKGSRWYVKESAWTQETREVVVNNTLPIIPVAVNGNYYIISGKQLQRAEQSTFTNLGPIKTVKALPDTTKIVIKSDVVYVLTKKQGESDIGSKFIFDATKKEFVEYTEETE